MWWAVAKALLDKNGSPAWQRVNKIMSIWNASQSNSARQQTQTEV